MIAMAPAMAQDTVYAGQTTNLTVVSHLGESYKWELYNNVAGLNLALVPGNCPVTNAFFVGNVNTGSIVQVSWLLPGTYYFKITTTTTCTNNMGIGEILVLWPTPTATIVPPPPICVGDSLHLTVILTGTAPWSITTTDGVNSYVNNNIISNPFTLTIPSIPMVTTTYWISQITDAHLTNTTLSPPVVQVVNPKPVNSHIYHYGP
jgi:hypothetical protein